MFFGSHVKFHSLCFSPVLISLKCFFTAAIQHILVGYFKQNCNRMNWCHISIHFGWRDRAADIPSSSTCYMYWTWVLIIATFCFITSLIGGIDKENCGCGLWEEVWSQFWHLRETGKKITYFSLLQMDLSDAVTWLLS